MSTAERLTRPICRTWGVRALGVLAAFWVGGAAASPPAEYTTLYNGQTCSSGGCHGLPPLLPPTSNIVPAGAASGSGAGLRGVMAAAGTMSTILASPALTDTVLDTIRLYLISVRDGALAVTAGSSTAFGSAAVTANGSTQSFTITNERRVAASFVAGPAGSNAEFVRTGGTCGASLAASTSCTVLMQFQPAATGARAGTLSFTLDSTNVAAQPRSIALSGSGTPNFDITATTLNFGSITATTTAVRSAIIHNTGGASFSLGTLTFGGASPALYSLAPTNTCTPGLSIAAGGQCQLDVRFAPLAAGAALDATLTVTHGGTGSPQLVTLLGAATPAPQGKIELSALALTYPDTQLGSTSAQSITVKNTGDATLTLTAFTPGGAAPGDFVQSGTCGTGSPLAINATCTLTLTFQPSVLGSRTASLTLASDASNGPATVALSGAGVAVPAPVVGLTPPTLDFGGQSLGGLYPKRVVTLTNTGTANLAIGAVTVAGAGFADASTAACPSTLAPGASCAIDIAFTPVAVDTDYTGTVTVASNAAGTPHTINLLGRGVAATVPVLIWQPTVTQLDFGLVSAGIVSAPQSATLLNNGPGGATLTVLNAVGVDSAAFVVGGGSCQVGTTLFQGDSCQVVVQFAPSSAGAKSAAVQVASTGSFPPALALVGNGLAGPAPGLSLSTATLAFAATRVGAQSVPLEVVLLGSGSGVVRVTSLDVSGPYAMHAKTCPAVPFVLQAGATCAVTVTFEPHAAGASSGMLRVASDATPADNDVALSGQADAPADVSSGGCSMAAGDSLADPTLWALAALAAAVLLRRRRTRAAGAASRGSRRAPR